MRELLVVKLETARGARLDPVGPFGERLANSLADLPRAVGAFPADVSARRRHHRTDQQIGTPLELYERPANRFVADFLGASNLVPGKLGIGAAGEVLVKTPSGEWRGRSAPAGLQPGADAAVSIRPEAIRRAAPDASGPNVFASRLADWVYLGDMAELWLALPDGLVLKALETKPAGAPPAIGGAIRFQVDPADVVVLA